METLDAYVAALPLLLGAATAVWLLSVALRDAGIADVFWGLGFVALAFFYFSRGGPADQRTLATLFLVSLWGVRLSTHIFLRGRGAGEGKRYAAMALLEQILLNDANHLVRFSALMVLTETIDKSQQEFVRPVLQKAVGREQNELLAEMISDLLT